MIKDFYELHNVTNNIVLKDYYGSLDTTNDKRLKLYFNLTELMSITGLSIRTLKYRMAIVKKKYINIPSLLSKKRIEWQIHYSLIKEFMPKYNIKTKTLHNYNWESTATWNPQYNYDVEYHTEIVNQIKAQLPNNILSYAVETDSRGINHTHVISDAQKHELYKAVSSTILKFIENPKECQIYCETIHNKYSAVEYIKKAPLKNGVL